MSVTAEKLTWRLVGQSAALAGYGFGSRYPGLTGVIEGQALTQQQLATAVTGLQQSLPELKPLPNDSVALDEPRERFRISVEWILATMHEMQIVAELPVYEIGRIVSIDQRHARFYLPTVQGAFSPLFNGLQALLALINHEADSENAQHPLKQIAQALVELNWFSPTSSNVPRFIQAAYNMAIPFQDLPGQIVQYGQGKRGRWLKSSFTEGSSQISATLARSKLFAAAMLRQAGIPVPDHQLVPDVETALQVAERLGYPVVVKPADLDGGIGVFAGLRSAEEVRKAYLTVHRPNQRILVEKHIEGKDYRVTVFQGEVISAVERVPAGVTGDGRHTIRELVEQTNADPRRGEGKHATLKRLALTAEALELMRQAGLEAASVPQQGQFVRLCRIANVTSGGMPVAVLDRIHPDNRLLAIRAVQALRLDFGGVDILMPEISRSWRENGAAICEVNGQPTFGRVTSPHLYPVLLRRLVPGNGRVPTVVVLGDASSKLMHMLESVISRNNVVVGCHDFTGVRIKGEVVREGAVEPFAAGQMLSIDANVGAMIVSINDDSVLRTGMPFARFDVLVVAGLKFSSQGEAVKGEKLGPLLTALLHNILPACDGQVITIEQPGLKIDGFTHVTSAQWQNLANENYDVLSAILSGIDDAEERHRTGKDPAAHDANFAALINS